MSTSPIRSWRAASRYANVPITSLREALKRAGVHPTTGPDGKLDFDVATLDAIRAARGTPIAAAIAAPSTAATSQLATAPAAAPSATTALAWAEAVAARGVAAGADDDCDDDGDDRNDDETDAPAHEPPFWAQASAIPSLPIGDPMVDPVTRVISYRPVSAAVAGSSGTLVQQLQQQLAELQGHLAHARAERDRYRTAWRVAQASSIAHAISAEALLAGAGPDAAQLAWSAAGAAADQLSGDQLADAAGYALSVARAAGQQAVQQVDEAISWQYEQRERAGYDDLALARRRRSRRF